MKNIFFAITVAALFTSCLKGENEYTCNYDACGYTAPASEIQSVENYLSTNSITAVKHCSGFYYAITDPGTGTAPTVCNYVAVNYEGKLTDGTVFDKTQPGTPASFALSQVITGFKNGLLLLKTGGKVTLYIPPSLGYGNSPQPGIPANSILIFSVELLGVQ